MEFKVGDIVKIGLEEKIDFSSKLGIIQRVLYRDESFYDFEVKFINSKTIIKLFYHEIKLHNKDLEKICKKKER